MTTKESKVYSINISKTKGTPKTAVETAQLIENLGLEQDAHAQGGIKQVSLLAIESIRKQNSCPKIKKGIALKPGDFAENITTEGINLTTLKIGEKLSIGEVTLEISKIGKECHKYCAIYYKTGDCIMPREGIFAKIIKGGVIKRNDAIKLEKI